MADFNYRLENAMAGLRAYGYMVLVKPIDGLEDSLADELVTALKNVDATADWLRKEYGYRGNSKRLIATLHKSIPEPAWGVKA